MKDLEPAVVVVPGRGMLVLVLAAFLLTNFWVAPSFADKEKLSDDELDLMMATGKEEQSSKKPDPSPPDLISPYLRQKLVSPPSSPEPVKQPILPQPNSFPFLQVILGR
jgi:hypothetical protein